MFAITKIPFGDTVLADNIRRFWEEFPENSSKSVQPGQQVTRDLYRGFCFCGSVKERRELYERGEARNDASTKF